MQNKIVVVSQHYPPDRSTTAAILSAIAEHLATDTPVVVFSGTLGSASRGPAAGLDLSVIEIKNWMPAKAALIRRAAAEILFTMRTFFALLKKLRRGDVVLTVTAPFMLPYAVAAAAKLKHSQSVLIMHDLFPDVLVVAGVLGERSLVAKVIRAANSWMFRALNAVVVIGRDTEALLLSYGKMIREKIVFIPNWTTVTPRVRPAEVGNPYRPAGKQRFIAGLSGNLGFTHDPTVVFEAAKLLRDDSTIHFLLSGWGIGFEKLKALQIEANLPNVTLVERVAEENLERLLSAADAWIIPYRKNASGVSIPSRFYNLLAVGRPVILISEPEAEAAVTVTENNLGWVVAPGMPAELAGTLRLASLSNDPMMARRAVEVAETFNIGRAMAAYAGLIHALLLNSKQPEHTS